MAPKIKSIDYHRKKGEGEVALAHFDDGSEKIYEIYEYHGSFKATDVWIIHGHEEIIVLDEYGEIKGKSYTR